MIQYKITYSKEFKLYDLVITKNNKFFEHYHITSKKELMKLIK